MAIPVPSTTITTSNPQHKHPNHVSKPSESVYFRSLSGFTKNSISPAEGGDGKDIGINLTPIAPEGEQPATANAAEEDTIIAEAEASNHSQMDVIEVPDSVVNHQPPANPSPLHPSSTEDVKAESEVGDVKNGDAWLDMLRGWKKRCSKPKPVLGRLRAISNYESILPAIDTALGQSAPPSVEYIFVEPYTSKVVFQHFGIGVRPFGHSAVRYTLPDGRQYLINITKKTGCKLVEFLDPTEWLYGISETNREQGGVYTRHIIGLRIEKVPPETILKMHQYFENVRAAVDRQGAAFSTMCGPAFNKLRACWPVNIPE
ncbi:hypothetical protein HDV00_005154, partial [Rhizophlyctis rosea]